MKINDDGLRILKSYEGLELKAYKDSVGVLTIGYGHTSAAGKPEVKSGMKITEKEAEDILRVDLAKFEEAVFKRLKRTPTNNQFSAMVSLCYNIGPGNFEKSTVLKAFNEGNIKLSGEAFDRWNKAGGVVLRGLVKRRAAERALFERA